MYLVCHSLERAFRKTSKAGWAIVLHPDFANQRRLPLFTGRTDCLERYPDAPPVVCSLGFEIEFRGSKVLVTFIRTALQGSRGVSGLPCRVITRTAPRIAIPVRLALMKAKLDRSHDSAPKNDVVPYRVLHNFGVVSQLQVLHNAVFVKGDCPRR